MKLAAILLSISVTAVAFAQPWSPQKTGPIEFDSMFPRLPFFGQTARQTDWSADEKKLAYVWNPYGFRYADIWLYDADSGKSARLTSIEAMAVFDEVAKKAIERYKKEDKERDDSLKLNEKEYREYQIKRQKENENRRGEEQPDYPGVSQYSWSKTGHSMLFVYRGDLFKWQEDKDGFQRLTNTRDAESDPSWMPDGKGFYFRRGEGIYSMRFDSAEVVQLDPRLPEGQPLWGYSLSPDGSKMMVFSGKSGQYRQIEWITYRGRFPVVRRTNQFWGTSDEKIQEERYLYLFDLTKPQGDGNKPWEVFKWKSDGDEILDVSTHESPWSPDSKNFVFAVHSSATREVDIKIATLADQRLDSIHKSKFPGEGASGDTCLPFYMPDGRSIVATLETTGYRQPWLIDPVTEAARPLLSGNFMAYPIQATPDGKSLVVWSTAMHTARAQVYAVDVSSGAMTRLSGESGNYRRPTVSKSAQKWVAAFASWSSPVEAHVWVNGRESTLTDSHRPGAFAETNIAKPEIFSFKNRHGQDIQGFVFLPPGFKKEDERPAMVYTYGGPLGEGHTVVDGDFNSTAYLFNMYLSQCAGYVAVSIDPRGTSDYGGAFSRANFGAVGTPQTEDLVDCAKYMEQTWGTDPKRMALNGWSFGGWQTQHVMYHAPDVYTLGIAGAGPTEWQNYNQGYTQETIAVEPEGSTANLDKFSLTKVATNLKHPLMILHGMEDANVLFQHSIAVYRVLLQFGLGPLVEFVVDPTGAHGLGGDINRRDTLAIYLRFLQKHWGVTGPDGKRVQETQKQGTK